MFYKKPEKSDSYFKKFSRIFPPYFLSISLIIGINFTINFLLNILSNIIIPPLRMVLFPLFLADIKGPEKFIERTYYFLNDGGLKKFLAPILLSVFAGFIITLKLENILYPTINSSYKDRKKQIDNKIDKIRDLIANMNSSDKIENDPIDAKIKILDQDIKNEKADYIETKSIIYFSKFLTILFAFKLTAKIFFENNIKNIFPSNQNIITGLLLSSASLSTGLIYNFLNYTDPRENHNQYIDNYNKEYNGLRKEFTEKMRIDTQISK